MGVPGDLGVVAAPPLIVKAPDRVEADRYHSLDAVRGFALLLGVVFHAAESFGRENYYWAIVDSSPSDLLQAFRFAAHSFRMELFFLIAGFFARLLLQRRGTSAFVANRLRRILGPLVVGWLILYPILVYLWLYGAAVSGRLGEMGLPPEAKNLPLIALVIGFFMTGGFLQKFDLTHLWFLHQLLVIYVIVLGLRWIILKRDTLGRLRGWLDARVRGLCDSWGGVFVLALITMPILLCMRSWDVDTPKNSLLPSLPVTAVYCLCFLIGWGLHRQPALLSALNGRWAGRLSLAAACCVILIVGGETIPFRQLSKVEIWWIRVAYSVVYGSMMWAFVFGFLGLLNRAFSRPNPLVRYTADASYWIYLVHLPLVVALQILVGRWAMPWPVKYGFILVVAFPVLFGTYHYLVRGTWIGLALNGRRYKAG